MPRQRECEQREDDRAGVESESLQDRRNAGAFGVVDEGVLSAEAHVSLSGGEQQQQAGRRGEQDATLDSGGRPALPAG